MHQKTLLGVAALCAMSFSAGAWAADTATVDEVIAKVKEAAADVKTHGDTALAEYDKKDGKWAWKDSYVFVMDCTAGTMKAHPSPQVKDIKLIELKDKATGKEFGSALCTAGKKEKGGWVEYLWTKPGAEGNHRKVVYVLPAGKYEVAAGVYDDSLKAADLEAKTQ